MEIIFELIFTFFGELLVLLVAEILAEFGLHSIAETVRAGRKRNPVAAFLGYIMLGALAGWISLLIFDHAVIKVMWQRIAMLIALPTVAGLTMAWVGSIRDRKGQQRIRLDSFSYGFVFALTMALIRFYFAG